MSLERPAQKKLPLLKLAVVAGVVLVVGALFLRGVNLRELGEEGMAWIRDAGPVVFFFSMALLPAVGVPASPFTLTAGSAFGEQLGLGVVVLLAVSATAANIVLSYFLARRALRPILERLMVRLGYKLPQVETRDAGDLVVIVRITPGIPFFVQNYLLGMADVPFRKYLIGSLIIAGSYTAVFVLFGNALLQGEGRMIFLAVGLLVALAAIVHFIRRHYGRRGGSSSSE